jgi:hypothetical protein
MRRLLVGVGLLTWSYACGSDGGGSQPGGEVVGGAGGEGDTAAGGSTAGRTGNGGTPSIGGTSEGGAPPMSDGGSTPVGEGGMPGNVQGGMPGEAQAGTANAGEGGEAGSSATGPVQNPILPEGTHFLDYGVLRVAFSLPVKAASLSATLTPSLRVSEIKQVDATTVEVRLLDYHLPRDYTLEVSGNTNDARAFQTQSQLPGLSNGSRVAFITKASGTGALKGWADAPLGALTPRDAADAICQGEAGAAQLKGKFVAFLGEQGKYDPGCRAFGLDGLLANKCGQANAPTDDAPWLSPTGLPIVNGATNVISGAWQNAFSFYADGTRAQQVGIWTGAITGAKAQTGAPGPTSSDCVGWTLNTNFAEVTEFVGEYLIRYEEFGSGCGTSHELLCLQVGGNFFGPSTLHTVLGKRTFVSKGKLTGAMSYDGKTGRNAADALCQAEASSANYANASNFHAYLSTSDDDAVCHILGLTGKASAKCGLAALPATNPWRRPDDYPVGTAAQIALANLTAPIAFAADGSAQFEQRPWTGTSSNGGVSSTCQNWSSGDMANSGACGLARALTNGFTLFTDGKCNAAQPVYCFEQ